MTDTWGGHSLDPLDSDGHVRPVYRRQVALALAAHATAQGRGRESGDPVHEEVTEGRRLAWEQRRARGSKEVPYSSCGDLGHWLLRCLGCTDETVVNRDDDGGDVAWKVGVNVSRLVGSPWYVRAGKGREPTPGDILFVMNAHGGHIAVLVDWSPGMDRAIFDEYGQPYGLRRTHVLLPRQDGGWTIDGNPLHGWIDLDRVPLDGPARLPPEVEAVL